MWCISSCWKNFNALKAHFFLLYFFFSRRFKHPEFCQSYFSFDIVYLFNNQIWNLDTQNIVFLFCSRDRGIVYIQFNFFLCSRTLEGLVSKGVKVDLGIPHELWDKPSAEITQLKTQCEALLENYEEDIEDWYFNNQVKL